MKNQAAKTPLTKEDLKEELKQSEERQEKKFDQKLAKRLTDSFTAFRAENKYEFSLTREELTTTMSKFTDLIFTAIDPLLKEIETRREDREIGTAQMEEVKTRIHDHEKRITKLEHS